VIEPDADAEPSAERVETDAKLRHEREQADAQLAGRASAQEKTADAVVDEARKRADDVLATDREKADATLVQSGVIATPPQTQSKVRASEDVAVTRERALADDTLRTERAEQRRALKRLLRLEREDTDERLLAERVRADRAVASRDDFLSMVSHDVRGILASMATSAELLLLAPQDSPAAERAHLHGQRIGRLTWRMNRLVGDLLDVVSMESGKLQMERAPGDATRLLAETIEAFHLPAAARGITLTSETFQDEVLADFDHDRILQVLTNLVGNAMKFTAEGGNIALQLRPSESGIQFTVRDTGSGIAADMLDGIFERFSQAAQNDRRGLGLGLYIARSIVEAHGGTIWAESEVGKGSAFHFTIPNALVAG